MDWTIGAAGPFSRSSAGAGVSVPDPERRAVVTLSKGLVMRAAIGHAAAQTTARTRRLPKAPSLPPPASARTIQARRRDIPRSVTNLDWSVFIARLRLGK